LNAFSHTQFFSIGCFTIDLNEHSLRHENGTIELLQPKFIEVLHYLAHQYPAIVSREELIENIWNGNNYVGEKALTNAISHIRKKLSQADCEYIQTIRKSGYRLLQTPTWPDCSDNVSSKSSTTRFNVGKWGIILGLVLFAGIVVFIMLTAPQDKVNIVSITSSPGGEFYPVASPDGTKIAYYWKQINKNSDLYIKDLTQPDLPPTQITFNRDSESRPVWNNKGNKIYYSQKNWNRTRCNIIELDLLTKMQRRIAKCKPTIDASLALSNSGKTLAFNSFDSINTISGIYLLQLDQSEQSPVRFSCAKDCGYSDRDAVFSPDDKFFAIARRSQQFEEDIFLVNRASGATKRLTTGQRDIHGMAWHPTKNLLIYSAEVSEVRNGYALNIDNGEIHSLNVPGFSFPSFTHSGDEVMYHDWQVNEFVSSFELRTDTTSVPFPLIQSEYIHTSPDVSEISQQVAYISNESGHRELWVVALNGNNRVQLTAMEKNIFSPRWSHDGKYIALLVRHNASDKNSINIVDVNTKVITPLPGSDLTGFNMPTWMQNDKRILVSATNKDKAAFYAVNISDGKYKALIESPGGYAIHTAENEIWYSANHGIYKVSLDADVQIATLIIPEQTLTSQYSWLKANEGIYFLQNQADHQKIKFLNESTNEITSILKLPLRSIGRNFPLSIIEEKEQLIFTQTFFPQVNIKKLHHPLLSN